jgi:hypothetical protein
VSVSKFIKMAPLFINTAYRNSQAAYFLLTSLLIYSLYLSWSSTGALRAPLCEMWSSTGALCATHLCALALLRMLRSFNQTGIENILYRTQSKKLSGLKMYPFLQNIHSYDSTAQCIGGGGRGGGAGVTR